MSSYTNIFGGNNVNTAFPSYVSYTIDEDEVLTWATTFVDNDPNNVTAQITDINATVPNLTVTLASAEQISSGQTVQFNNVGANAFTVNDANNGFLLTIQPTEQFVLYLKDNTTVGGTWGITHYGAGTASAQASALAGLGTIALNSVINTNFPSKSINTNYTAVIADRASLIVWTGGSGTLTLPVLADVGAGYYLAVNNVGGGVITLVTTDGTTIDELATFPLNPGQSSSIIAVSPNWNSLGFGTETLFQTSALTKNITGGATVTLTAQEASRLIQTYTGALAQNVTVLFPDSAGQWYVSNTTTNAFTVTLQRVSGGNSIVIPQGEKFIVYSDGTNLFETPTVTTTTIFGDGNVGTPSIHFGSDLSSGFYKLSAGGMGYSRLGTLALSLGTLPGGAIGIAFNGGNQARFYNAGNSFFASIKAGNMASDVNWTLPLLDATASGQVIYSNAAGILGFTTTVFPTSTTINQILYSSAANTVTGLATANNGVFVTGAGGIPAISSIIPNATQDNITRLGTIVSGVWNGTVITVPYGGTGLATLTTAYGVVCAGTTATGILQNAGTGTVDQIFSSNGNAALPSWQTRSALKADQITATSTTQFVNPAVQQFHASAIKAWVRFQGSDATIHSSYNIASVVRNSTGNYTITFTVPFANALYLCIGMPEQIVGLSGAGTICRDDNLFSTTQSRIQAYNVNFAPADLDQICVIFVGLQ